MYQNSIQIGLEKNEERTVEVLEADDSERHSGIAKKGASRAFQKDRNDLREWGEFGGNS